MSADLMRLLNSIGKSVFVEYYDIFSSSKLSTDEKIEKLPREYSINGSRTRINCAKRIFERGLEKDALRIVIQAKVDDQIKAWTTQECIDGKNSGKGDNER